MKRYTVVTQLVEVDEVGNTTSVVDTYGPDFASPNLEQMQELANDLERYAAENVEEVCDRKTLTHLDPSKRQYKG